MIGRRSGAPGSGLLGDERGVSDVVSFVLVFALMIASIAAVTTVGISALQDFREGERANSAERAFEATGAAVDEVAAGGSPRRTSELDLRDGTLFVQQTGPSVAVRVDSTVGGGATNWVPIGPNRTNALVYRFDDTSIAYASGTLIRSSSGGGAVAFGSPRMICSPEGAVVSVVHVEAVGPSSIGSETARIDVRRNSSRILFPSSGGSPTGAPAPVELKVDTPNQEAWNETLTSSALGWSNPDGDNRYECDTDRLFVRRANVTINFVT